MILENKENFQYWRYWEEMCTARSLKHVRLYGVHCKMVCLNVKTRLIHDSSQPLPDGGDLTLGELLRRKGAEGVHVIGLALDDKTSHSNPLL